MIRAILSVFAAAMLAGCMTTESSPTAARSMAAPEPPTFTISVVTGIKSAPVDSPLVRLTWSGADSVTLDLWAWSPTPGLEAKFFRSESGKDFNFLHVGLNGSTTAKASCRGLDSIEVKGTAETLGVGFTNASAWVYCK